MSAAGGAGALLSLSNSRGGSRTAAEAEKLRAVVVALAILGNIAGADAAVVLQERVGIDIAGRRGVLSDANVRRRARGRTVAAVVGEGMVGW